MLSLYPRMEPYMIVNDQCIHSVNYTEFLEGVSCWGVEDDENWATVFQVKWTKALELVQCD